MSHQSRFTTRLEYLARGALRRQGYGGQAETQRSFHRELNPKCGVNLALGSTQGQNKRHGFLKQFIEGEELRYSFTGA